MVRRLALGLDLGTTSISAVAVDEEGRPAAAVGRPNSSAVPGLPPGWAEQDPRQIRATALDVLHELAARADGSPQCLGLTGQMHGMLLVDGRRRPLTNLITWQDRRANEPSPRPTLPASVGGLEACPTRPDGRLEACPTGSWLDEYLARCSEAALYDAGCRPAAGYLAVTLFVLAAQGGLPTAAHRAAFAADWLAAEVCDRPIVTDRSHAASSGVYDLRHDRWSDELVAAAGFPAALLPEVRESGEVIGELVPEAAAATGLPAGLPVCNAVGDNQAAVLGSVPAGDPAIQINVGTGGQINWPVPEFVRVEGMDTRYLPQGRFMLVGAGLAGGDAYAWVQRTARAWLAALGQEASDEALYARLGALADSVPDDCDGLVCEPLFRGTRRRPQARGTFTGVTFDNFTPGHVARAVLQGIAAAMRSFYDQAGDWRPSSLGRIVGSGNGLRKNPLLVRVLAQTFGREVWLPVHEEEAARGAALLAGTMVGLWPDLVAAGECIDLARVVGALDS